jgi:leucyl-tRNA synthetase
MLLNKEHRQKIARCSCNVVLNCASRDSKTWNTSGIEGVHRFLGRTWRLIVGSPSPDGTFRDGTVAVDEEPSLEQLRSLHKCIAKVTSQLMRM